MLKCGGSIMDSCVRRRAVAFDSAARVVSRRSALVSVWLAGTCLLLACNSRQTRQREVPNKDAPVASTTGASIPAPSQPLQPGFPTVPLGSTPTPEDLQRVQQLRTSLLPDATFHSRANIDPKNHTAFLYLAAQGKSPELVAAALSGIAAVYSRVPQEEPERTDLTNVIVRRLSSTEPRLAARAAQAARLLAAERPPQREVIRAIEQRLHQAKTSPEVLAFMEPLERTSGTLLQSKTVTQVVDTLLSEASSAALLIEACTLGVNLADRVEEHRAKLEPRLSTLSEHSDPGVRAAALRLLPKVSRDAVQSKARLIEALRDDSSYVRASSASALGETQDLAVVHHLMALIDDNGANKYVLGDFKRLDGSEGRLSLGDAALANVSAVALTAIERLSGELRLENFVPSRFESVLEQNRATVRSWYASKRSSLPPSKPATAASAR